MVEFKMTAIIKLSQNEWVKFFCANGVGTNLCKCEWVESGKTEDGWNQNGKFKLAEFKIAAIIKLSQNEWVKFFCAKWELSLGKWQSQLWGNHQVDGWIQWFWVNQFVESEEWSDSSVLSESWQRVWEEKLTMVSKMVNPTWQNSRWLPSSSWVRMNEWSFFVQMVGTNLGKCESVWEDKLRWMNQRWPNSKWQYSRWLPSFS